MANSQKTLEETRESNKRVVWTLYEGLSSGDVDKVHRLFAPDIEWWFHGPPSHQHMMRLLTGVPSDDESFIFVPISITDLGSRVLVEGFDKNHSVSWVHAWTVNDGIITQLREYINTSLTVTLIKNSSQFSPSSSSSTFHCENLWQSSLSDSSVPGIILAI